MQRTEIGIAAPPWHTGTDGSALLLLMVLLWTMWSISGPWEVTMTLATTAIAAPGPIQRTRLP